MSTPSWETLVEAVKEANATRTSVGRFADNLADVLHDVLHNVGTRQLKRLKRELTKFDAAEGKWK